MAAQTTWKFIQEVGLNTIVPIPYIAIHSIDINFKANISVVFRQAAGYFHFELKYSDKTVIFDLTDKVSGKPQGTLAVLRINKEYTDIPITEIEFVQPK